MSYKKGTVVGVALMSIVLVGCGSDPVASSGGGESSTDREVTVTRCGEDVTYRGTPTKITASAVGLTDTLFDMGLEDSVVAVGSTAQGDPAPEYQDKFDSLTKLGTEQFGTREQVLSSGTDLVYAENSTWPFDPAKDEATVEDLEKAGIGVYIANQGCGGWGGSFDGLYTDVTNLGKITNHESKATDLVSSMKDRVSKAQRQVAGNNAKVAILGFDPSGTDLVAIGPKYTQGEMLTQLGVHNVFDDLDEAYSLVNPESIIDRNPDIIFVGVAHMEDEGAKATAAKEMQDKLRETTAGRNAQIYAIDDMGGQPGSTRAIDQIEFMAQNIADAKVES
ncbi:ABC transporter substrate-binding protein [uncultured Propionibacterium sp.]|uniref:ABC transporter substrate-binding protein n=1 Tax=uncultured Propionibacterium sp. TaxID=218066 RepID=UPI0029309D01|nr:ABC transporter substrate-binding protein [uncultured Propionibacterium sp.]